MLLKYHAPVYKPARDDDGRELTGELAEQGFTFQ